MNSKKQDTLYLQENLFSLETLSEYWTNDFWERNDGKYGITDDIMVNVTKFICFYFKQVIFSLFTKATYEILISALGATTIDKLRNEHIRQNNTKETVVTTAKHTVWSKTMCVCVFWQQAA